MSNTAQAFLIAAIAGLVVVLIVLGIRHRLRGRVGGRMKFALALASLALLIAITALDWPLASVSEFFSTHSVFTGMVTTLLLVGAGYFAWDSESERKAEYLDDGFTATGFGGLVETLSDIDFALTCSLSDPSGTLEHMRPGKPLRWIRTWRDEIEGGAPDPRNLDVIAPAQLAQSAEWRDMAEQVVTECLRRLSGGLRDWAPLLTKTPSGSEAIVLAARGRYELMHIEELDDWHALGSSLNEQWDRARTRMRFLALALKLAAGSGTPRWYLSRKTDDLLLPANSSFLSSAMIALPASGSMPAQRAQARQALELLDRF